MTLVPTEQILVVPTELLHRLGYFQGFTADVERYLEELLSPQHTSYRPRPDMEHDPGFKQLIPYVLFRHTEPGGRRMILLALLGLLPAGVLAVLLTQEDTAIGARQAFHQTPLVILFFIVLPVASLVFGVTRGMLDPRTPAEVRPFLLKRLNRYAGLEKGYRPLTELARERTLERLAADPGLLGPYRGDLEQDLANLPILLAGIREQLEESGLKGWQKPFKALERQLTQYAAWVRADLLPRARSDHRLPDEVYADNLRNYGVDIPVDELIARALTSFAGIRNEMQALATLIAAQRGLPDSDYRAVILSLKQAQVPNDELLQLYRERLAVIERIIETQRIVTLPERPASIRLASPAESAQRPAPHMQPPRLINNTGQYGEFVLPLALPPAPGGRRLAYDDFSHDPGTWTLIAHEARPGHELQFARLIAVPNQQALVRVDEGQIQIEAHGLLRAIDPGNVPARARPAGDHDVLAGIAVEEAALVPLSGQPPQVVLRILRHLLHLLGGRHQVLQSRQQQHRQVIEIGRVADLAHPRQRPIRDRLRKPIRRPRNHGPESHRDHRRKRGLPRRGVRAGC